MDGEDNVNVEVTTEAPDPPAPPPAVDSDLLATVAQVGERLGRLETEIGQGERWRNVESSVTGLASRLDSLSSDLARLSSETAEVRSALQERTEQQSSTVETMQVPPPPETSGPGGDGAPAPKSRRRGILRSRGG